MAKKNIHSLICLLDVVAFLEVFYREGFKAITLCGVACVMNK